jgi:hypothetical protein
MRALSLACALLLGVAAAAAAADENHRRVAEHYAPVVFQESRSTVLDFITKFRLRRRLEGRQQLAQRLSLRPARSRLLSA